MAKKMQTKDSTSLVAKTRENEPLMAHGPHEIQPFGTVTNLPIGLSQQVRLDSTAMLNQVLVDTMVLRDMYKKHHWQVSGHTFYQLHLLFDKHFDEQAELVDTLAERIQSLGGVAVAMAHDVAELTRIPRPPRGREQVPTQISRLLQAHEMILIQSRKYAKDADEAGDDGTNDLLVSEIVRTNELQVWFLAEHLVDTPLIEGGDRG